MRRAHVLSLSSSPANATAASVRSATSTSGRAGVG